MNPARRGAATVVALLVLGLGLLTAPIAASTDRAAAAPPVTVVPPLPEQLDPLAEGISPVMWEACRGVGLAVGLVAVAGTLIGVPPEASQPVNDGLAFVAGPALGVFFELCQRIPLPDDPPTCETDALVPLLPTLGRPIPPAALLANELRALGMQFVKAGVPLGSTLGDAADDLLACTHGKNPEPDEPGAEPTPITGGGGFFAPGPPGGNAHPIAGLGDVPALGDEGFPGAPKGLGSDLAAPQAIRASAPREGRGLAIALGLVGVLAVLGWVHAGNARSRSIARRSAGS